MLFCLVGLVLLPTIFLAACQPWPEYYSCVVCEKSEPGRRQTQSQTFLQKEGKKWWRFCSGMLSFSKPFQHSCQKSFENPAQKANEPVERWKIGLHPPFSLDLWGQHFSPVSFFPRWLFSPNILQLPCSIRQEIGDRAIARFFRNVNGYLDLLDGTIKAI